MKVVILCGGQGTRLREETEYRPKPLVEVGGKPILWHIMKLYAHYGFTEFILCLGYRGNMIKQYFLDYEAMTNDFTMYLDRQNRLVFHGEHNEFNFCITLCNTGLNAMTGSRIKQIEQHITGDTFMVTYGDGVSSINIPNLLRFHHEHGRLATITAVQPVSRFGVLEIDEDGSVTQFIEKPKIERRASAGFFVFNRSVLDYLSIDPSCVLEREPLEQLARDGQLVAFPHDGFFFAMDTYREYLYLNDLWDQGHAPWAVWEQPSHLPAST